MKKKLKPTRTSFSRNFQCKKAPRWLSKFFSFWYWKSGGPVKKPPCMLSTPNCRCWTLRTTTWERSSSETSSSAQSHPGKSSMWVPNFWGRLISWDLFYNSGFCWKLVCFRLSWRTSWREQRLCRFCETCHRKALLQLSLDVLHLNKNSISTDSSTNGPSLRNHDWRANPHLWFGKEVMGRATVTRTSQTRVKTQSDHRNSASLNHVMNIMFMYY